MSHPCPARRRVVAGVVAGLAALLVIAAAAPAGGASRDARCTRLDTRIEDLRLRLRMGYTEPQGRRWRQQLRGLEAERRATCR
jgi:hypothetical protein